MERLTRPGHRAYAFLFGEYGGPPVDYLLAIAAVYAAMIVMVARNLLTG